MSLRPRRLLLLVPPTARSTDWLPGTASGMLAVAVVTLARDTSPALCLGLAAAALAMGSSFALDDPAATSLEASPAPLVLRHAVRASCALPLPAAVWLGLVQHFQAVDGSELTLVLAGLVASALAIAAVACRAGESGGLVAAPTLLMLVACAFVLPERVSLFPDGDPGEANAFIVRWGLVLGLAACVFIAASRDPAHRRVLAKRSTASADVSPASSCSPQDRAA
jgi:hypothetical protein